MSKYLQNTCVQSPCATLNHHQSLNRLRVDCAMWSSISCSSMSWISRFDHAAGCCNPNGKRAGAGVSVERAWHRQRNFGERPSDLSAGLRRRGQREQSQVGGGTPANPSNQRATGRRRLRAHTCRRRVCSPRALIGCRALDAPPSMLVPPPPPAAVPPNRARAVIDPDFGPSCSAPGPGR